MRNISLSGRLLAAAELVTGGNVLADIGTDHGYLPIYLCLEEKIPRAYAMDVRTGPLSRAEEHIREYGLADRIETRLSDGLEKLKPGEAQSIAICGMGGALIRRILETGAAAADAAEELVLGPQSEVPEVRRFLERKGFRILNERMIREDGKYYTLIRTAKGEGKALTELEADFGPCLLSEGDHVLAGYLDWRNNILEEICGQLADAGSDEAKKRLGEVKEEMMRIRSAREMIRR